MKGGMDWSRSTVVTAYYITLFCHHLCHPAIALTSMPTGCRDEVKNVRLRGEGWVISNTKSLDSWVTWKNIENPQCFFLTYPKQSYFSESWNEDWWALLWCWMVAKVVDNKQVKRWWCQWLGTGTRWVWKVRLCYFMSISSNFVQLVGKKQDWHKILYCCWILYTWYRSCLWPTQLPTFCPSHLW